MMTDESNRLKLEEELFNKAYANIGEIEANLQQNYAGIMQQAAMDQRMAATDAWGSFFDGITNTGLTVMGAPIGAGGGSLFGKVFGGSNQVRVPENVPNQINRPSLGMDDRHYIHSNQRRLVIFMRDVRFV